MFGVIRYSGWRLSLFCLLGLGDFLGAYDA